MKNDLTSSFRPAIVMTGLFAILLGVGYPLAMTGIAQTLFPHQANGSLVIDRGKPIGSELIGQGFASDRYFHARPSAAGKGYDGMASGGSNFGPTSQALVDRMKDDIKALKPPTAGQPIPADLVTASGSGLDPDISPEAARYQAPAIAKVRGIPQERVAALIDASVETPLLPFLGDPHVNVLALNRQLDQLAAPVAR